MKPSLVRIAALVAAMLLTATACSSSDADADAASPAAGDVPTASIGDGSVLEISAPTADGSTIDLSTYAGQDLMLWFWAPW